MQKVFLRLLVALITFSAFTHAQPVPACRGLNYAERLLPRFGPRNPGDTLFNNILTQYLRQQRRVRPVTFMLGNNPLQIQYPIPQPQYPVNNGGLFMPGNNAQNIELLPPITFEPPRQLQVPATTVNPFTYLWNLFFHPAVPQQNNRRIIIDAATRFDREYLLPWNLQDSDSEDEFGYHPSDGTPYPPIHFRNGQFLITGGNPDDDDPGITFIPGGEPPIIYQATDGPPTPPSPGDTPIFAPALERFFRQLAHAFGSHGIYTPFPLLRALHDIPEEYAANFADTTHEEIAEEIDSEWERLQNEPHNMDTHTLAMNLFENLMQALFYGLLPTSPSNRTTDPIETFIDNLHESRERHAHHLADNIIFGHLVLEATLLVQAGTSIDDLLFPLLSRLSSAETIAEEELARLLRNEGPPSRETIDLALDIALHTVFELRLHLLRLHIDHPSNEQFRNAILRMRRSGIFDPQANVVESLVRQNGGIELSTEPHIIYMARLFARARHQFIRACLLAWDGHTEDLNITPYTAESYTSAFNLISLYFIYLKGLEPKDPPPTEHRE